MTVRTAILIPPKKKVRMSFMMRMSNNTKSSVQTHSTMKRPLVTTISAMVDNSSKIWGMSQPQNKRVSWFNKTRCAKFLRQIPATMYIPHKVSKHVIILHFWY